MLRERQSSTERETQSVNLRTLAGSLQAVVREHPDIRVTGRAASLAEEWRGIASFGQRAEVPPALVSYLQVDAFTRHFNLAWLVINDGT